MPGNDLSILIDQDRVGKTEARDRFGNLLDLSLRMRSSVFGIRF